MIKLHDSTAIEAQQRVKARLAAGGWIAGGFYFCRGCLKVTEDIGDQSFRCCWCGSPRVKFCEPIPELQAAVV